MRKDLTRENSPPPVASSDPSDGQSTPQLEDIHSAEDEPPAKRSREDSPAAGNFSPSRELLETPRVSPASVKDEVQRPDTPRPLSSRDSETETEAKPVACDR